MQLESATANASQQKSSTAMKDNIGPMERPGLAIAQIMVQPETAIPEHHSKSQLNLSPENKDGERPVGFVRLDTGHRLAPEIVGKCVKHVAVGAIDIRIVNYGRNVVMHEIAP